MNQLSLDTNEKIELFDTLVSSVLNYSAPVWGYIDGKSIELIQYKFLCKILGVKKKSTNLEVLY